MHKQSLERFPALFTLVENLGSSFIIGYNTSNNRAGQSPQQHMSNGQDMYKWTNHTASPVGVKVRFLIIRIFQPVEENDIYSKYVRIAECCFIQFQYESDPTSGSNTYACE